MSKLIRKSNKGFTLIELMIVVAIIGILAAIAIPNFLRFQLKSKSSEGKVNIAAIRTAEESYLAEFGVYVGSAVNPTAGVPGSQKAAFDTGGGFDTLGWSPEGNVFFQYAVNAPSGENHYTISAAADIDADSTIQAWGYVKPDNASPPVSVAGIHTECVAGGVGAGQNQLATVGPCDSTYGQSVF
ncbi:MAG: prepilin-type N-terminal cleavage/methylation domain-containing protein [Myxococcota bacterium]